MDDHYDGCKEAHDERMKDSKEVWKAVLGYEDLYEVSNLGRVKRLERLSERDGQVWVLPERILNLKPYLVNGVMQVSVHLNDGKGKLYHTTVGRLVCQAFNGQPPASDDGRKIYARHNSDPTDNHIDNVVWQPASKRKREHATNS